MHTISLWVLFSTLLSLQHVSGSVLANRAPTANKLSSSKLDTEGCSSYSATAGPHRVNLGVRQESGEDDEEGISECEELFQMDHALDEKEQQQLISGNYAGLNCVYLYAEVLNYLESVFKEHLPNALPKGLNGRDDKAGSTSKCEQARTLLQKQEESQPCHQIKDLHFVFALADEKWAGTYDYVGATIQGPAGKATLAIGDAPSRGFEAVMPVDMKASFGADIIDMDGINKITLTAQGHFWTLLPFKNDQWKVKGISLRAQCASPGFNATNDELSELNAWFGHPGGWGWKPLLETDVATFDVTAAAWSTAPPCAIIKALNYEFHVGDTGALGVAGADGSLLLALGEGKKITLGVDVSRGYSKTDAINFKDTFGSETVDIRNIKKMALLHEGGNDQWLLDGITFTATCVDKPKQMKLEKFGSQNEWITTSSWDRNDIGPQDWREIKA